MSDDYRRSESMRSSITISIEEYDRMRSAMARLEGWKLVSDGVPDCEDILVCVTYNLDDREYETKQWVDSWFEEIKTWMVYGERIDIPFPPTHWMPLPPDPDF